MHHHALYAGLSLQFLLVLLFGIGHTFQSTTQEEEQNIRREWRNQKGQDAQKCGKQNGKQPIHGRWIQCRKDNTNNDNDQHVNGNNGNEYDLNDNDLGFAKRFTFALEEDDKFGKEEFGRCHEKGHDDGTNDIYKVVGGHGQFECCIAK